MSKYSELIGSFIRTGNYPLEADYIFPDYESLKNYYQDPLNNSILHKGWFKIVENDGSGNQALYWVTKKQTNEELEFTKLIVGSDINDIYKQLDNLINRLEEEIQNRKDVDTAIWGTTDPSNLPTDLNSIQDLVNAIKKLREDVSTVINLKEEIKAVAGTTSNDIIAYLETLPYKSLTEVANILDKFLNEADPENPLINTLPEIQKFLEGYTDSNTLKEILHLEWLNIMGDPVPSEEFRTLRGVEDFVRVLSQWAHNRTDNLQTELDQTQIGVGLSGDGSFNADKETNYLKDATSVMNALKTLDDLVKKALSQQELSTKNTDCISLTLEQLEDAKQLTATLNLSEEIGNQLIKNHDGLYTFSTLRYENGVLSLIVNLEPVASIDLGLQAILQSGKYDPTTETIVLTFSNGQTISIPIDKLIREWEPSNTDETVVEITREQVLNGTDKVSADIKLDDNEDNILQKIDGKLLAKVETSKIKIDNTSLDSIITEITTDLSNHINDRNNPHQVTKEQVGLENVLNKQQVTVDEVGQPNGVAGLDENGKISQEQLPTFSSAVLEYDSLQQFPEIGESGRLYIDKSTGITYRWDGEKYVPITSSLQLGEEEGTAYPGNKGKEISDSLNNHLQDFNNPHKVTKEQIGLDKVNNTSDKEKPISNAVQQELTRLETLIQAGGGDAGEALANHVSDFNNPHKVTAEQIGTYTSEQLDQKFQQTVNLVDGKIPEQYIKIYWNDI